MLQESNENALENRVFPARFVVAQSFSTAR